LSSSSMAMKLGVIFGSPSLVCFSLCILSNYTLDWKHNSNNSPEPTGIFAFGRIVAVHVACRRWFSFLREPLIGCHTRF
jgi:hypothetical protein